MMRKEFDVCQEKTALLLSANALMVVAVWRALSLKWCGFTFSGGIWYLADVT